MTDPLTEIAEAREAARAANDTLVDACFLATVDAEGQPSARTLSLRHVDESGVGLLLNQLSPKWKQVTASGKIELLILWRSILRQFRVQGELRPMPVERLEDYWQRKGHGSRLLEVYYGEVQEQSSPIDSRDALLAGIDGLRARYPSPTDVPRPDTLLGLNLVPTRVEVWRGSPEDRLHDRRLFTREGESWTEQVLVP